MAADESQAGQLTTRAATAEDADLIVSFVHKLAEFEKEPLEHVRLDAQKVRQDAFGRRPRFEVILVERHGKGIGMALFFENYSTWTGLPGLWIEELFVEEQFRGQGAGQALLCAVAKTAKDRGCGRIELAVLSWNPAKEFYFRLGFSELSEWQIYRMEPKGIHALAGENNPG